MHIDALSVLCAQLTRDLLAIAKFLFSSAVDLLWTGVYNKSKQCSFGFDLLWTILQIHIQQVLQNMV